MRPESHAALARTSLDDAPLVFVDVETTGLDPWSGDRICEVAAVRFQGTREVDRFSALVNPLRAISAGAFAVNGITPWMLAGAPTFDAVAGSVRAILDGAVLVAHNAPFDLGFLGREFGLAGERTPSGVVVDTLALARRNFRFRSNSLGSLTAALGIRAPGHRALADALATREVFYHLVGRLFPRGALVGDVLRRQGGTVPWPAAPAMASLPADLAEAVQRGRTLRLWYVAGDGSETVRWVEPIRIAEQGDYPRLVAYCHLRQEERTFRLDRIVRWEVGVPPSDG